MNYYYVPVASKTPSGQTVDARTFETSAVPMEEPSRLYADYEACKADALRAATRARQHILIYDTARGKEVLTICTPHGWVV